MARRRRRKFSPEFKAEAVRLAQDTNAPIATLAQQLFVARGTLNSILKQAGLKP